MPLGYKTLAFISSATRLFFFSLATHCLRLHHLHPPPLHLDIANKGRSKLI
ncbi:hypothetical protein LguiB_026347 [Lonicera macranthoides]